MSKRQINAYCKNCRTERMCTVHAESNVVCDFCGISSLEYIELSLYCSVCGCEVESDDINEENRNALNEAYYCETGLVSIDAINAILEKYEVGKRTMSLLLGWGEHTLSRYLDGQKPSRKKSDVLRTIASDPHYLLKIAEPNKDKPGNTNAYDKLERKYANNPFDETISRDVLNAFVYLSRAYNGITSDAINDAMYFYFGFRAALYGEELIGTTIPLCSYKLGDSWFLISLYYNDHEHQRFFENYSVELSARNKLLLDNLIRYFLCYSTGTLDKFVATNIAALNPSSENSHFPIDIDNESVFSYFSAVKDKYKMLTPSDIRFYAEDLFRSVV